MPDIPGTQKGVFDMSYQLRTARLVATVFASLVVSTLAVGAAVGPAAPIFQNPGLSA